MKINKLARQIFCICLLFSSYGVKAQFLHDINGVPLTQKKYEDVTGTPFLYEEWSPGTVKFTNGKSYKENLFLKYNAKDDELYFKNKNGDPLLFVDSVSEFVITPPIGIGHHYRNGYKDVNGYSQNAFFEVVADGSVQLLKKTKKTILESKAYNSPTTERRFVTVSQYYLIKSGKAVAVKPDKKSVLSTLNDKQPALEKFIKENNLNLRNDDELAKLVVYYNSI
jgi:hypothetical protein